MNNLTVFDFNNNEVRLIVIDGEPWFIAVDVCKILEISDVSQACSRLDDDEKLIRTLYVAGQNRDVLTISESGLYSLVLTSRKTEAKIFKKWITSKVLPSIRKTGKYEIVQTDLSTSKSDIDLVYFVLDGAFAGTHIQPEVKAQVKLNAATKLLPQHLKETTKEPLQMLINVTATDESLVTVTAIGKQLGLSARKVNQLLIDKGLQVKNDKKSSKDPSYLPTSRCEEFCQITTATGENNTATYQQLRWYPSVVNALS